MTTFLVERRLPGLTREHLALVQRSLHAVAGTAGARYVRSFWIPAQERCLCVFEAESLEVVTRVNETAQVPFVAVTEAVQVTAPPHEAATGADGHAPRRPAAVRPRELPGAQS